MATTVNEEYITKVKIAVLFAVGATTLAASLLPWLIHRRIRGATSILSYCNCLAGGVVLGCALSHMLPDAEESFRSFFQKAGSSSPFQSYPFATLCAAFALLLLFAVDQFLLGATHSHSHDQFTSGPLLPHLHQPEPYPIAHPHTLQHAHDQASSPLLAHAHKQYTIPAEAHVPHQYVVADAHVHPHSHSHSHAHAHSHAHDHSHNHHGHHHVKLTKSPEAQASIFLIALSIHSLFEGLGLGSQQTQKGLYTLVVAVVSHKMLEAFALGVSIYYACFSTRRNTLFTVGYSLCTPLGIAGGMVAAKYAGSQSAELVAGILTSLATGSFLYVSLIEILPHEFESKGGRSGRFLFVIIGWLFMAFMAYYA